MQRFINKTVMMDRVDYSAAKAALVGMSKAIAMEVGECNVLVNCISPGAIGRADAIGEHMTYIGETGRAGVPKILQIRYCFWLRRTISQVKILLWTAAEHWERVICDKIQAICDKKLKKIIKKLAL